MPNPVRVTLQVTSAGRQLTIELPAVIETTGEPTSEFRRVPLPGLRKCQPVTVARRVAGGGR